MKKTTLIIYMLLFISAQADCQSSARKGEDIRDTTVALLQNIKDDKIIILFENKDVLVKTSLSVFENNMKLWLEKNPHLSDDKTLLDKIKQELLEKDIVDAEKIAKENKLYDRLKYRIADLLESGNCLIVDKKDTKVVKDLKIQTYSFYCGPLCGDGGRRFFIGDMIIFTVRDWVS